LYQDVSKALYDNDRQLLYDNAGYISELRNVFLMGQTSPIIDPFVGTAVRSLMLENRKLQAFGAQYEPGQAVCWASFTSMSDVSEHIGQHTLKGQHDGNVTFRISCGKMGPAPPGHLFPSVVKAFSAFPTEEEVIFPPYCLLRIVNVLLREAALVVEMETMGFDDVWDLIRNEDWSRFEMWASRNPELVNTRMRTFSMIGAVAESISKQLDKSGTVPNPFDVCVRHGADINELHRKETPLAILEKKLDRASSLDKPVFEAWSTCLRKHGATPTILARH